MTAETGFRGLTPMDARDPQKVSTIVSRMNQGKLNCTGTVTLSPGAATTTVSDLRVGSDSLIILMPTTANAAADMAAGNVYISARTAGVSFQISHPNNANADKNFGYAVIG
jgi:hypothetical protein